MADSEFCRLLRRYRKERHLTQQALRDKLKSQGYCYTESAISKWESGKRKPPADVVEVLEDILESPKAWLLKAAGYRADAQIRLSAVVDPEQAKHFQELSIALLALASNLESYRDQIGTDPRSRVGDMVYGGWLNVIDGTPDMLSVQMREVDRPLALNLLLHLKQEFPELASSSDWTQLTGDKISHDFIARLELKATRGDFVGNCHLCLGDWNGD